ncbi:MAG TPA: hypothetical protein VF070_01755 [Streptosporangiaceae bacterium]
MDSAEIAASDPRVRAILTEPDAYFSAALRRAWPQAGADIQGALDRRAQDRRNGTGRSETHRLLLRFTRSSRRPIRRYPVSRYDRQDAGL